MLDLVVLSTLFKRSTFFWQSELLSAFLCWHVLLVMVETFMQHVIRFPTCVGRVRDRQQSSDVTACCTLSFCFRIICQTSTETPFIVSSLDIRKITPKKKSKENQVLLVLLHWNQNMLYNHGHEHQSTHQHYTTVSPGIRRELVGQGRRSKRISKGSKTRNIPFPWTGDLTHTKEERNTLNWAGITRK